MNTQSQSNQSKSIVPVFKNELTDGLMFELADIVIEGFGDAHDLWIKRFKYWWCSNPYLQGSTPACWIIRDNDGKIVGFHANIPTQFQRGETVYPAIGSGTFYLSPSFRGPLSAALAVQPVRQKNIDIMIAATANDIANKIINSIGYRLVGGSIKIPNYLIITSLSTFMAKFSEELILNSEASSGIKKTILLAGAKVGHVASKIIPATTPKIRQPYLSSETHELRICENASSFVKYMPLHKNENTLEFSKDETTINWMLFSPEVRDLLHRKTMQVFTKDGEYCGYIICDVTTGSHSYLRLSELKLLKPDDSVIKLIIKHLKVEAKSNGYAMVSFALQDHNSKIDELLHKNIALCRKLDNNYYIKYRKNAFVDVDPIEIYVPSTLDPDMGFV